MTKELAKERFKVRHIRNLSFGGLRVFDAMRLKIVHLEPAHTIEEAIRQLIRHKAESVLVSDGRMTPLGVVSKTDIISAYYGELALDLKLQDIMSAPVICCSPDDKLDDALMLMETNSIHQLYVLDIMDKRVVGVISYIDVVGLLFRYCHLCEYGLENGDVGQEELGSIKRLTVSDVMTSSVRSMDQQASLNTITEELAMSQIGAVLLFEEEGKAVGVVSRTDLSLAYMRGTSLNEPASSIMSRTVYSCSEDESLEGAVGTMILSDLSRLFVYRDDPTQICGILTLSDAAWTRSGSCKSCLPNQLVP